MLVPELCDRFRYPAELWLKAELLPTALHRITQLLFVEELHATIARELGVGRPAPTWAPLVPDLASFLAEEPQSNGAPVGGFATLQNKVRVIMQNFDYKIFSVCHSAVRF